MRLDRVRHAGKREVFHNHRGRNHAFAFATLGSYGHSHFQHILQHSYRAFVETEVSDGRRHFAVLNEEKSVARQACVLQRLIVDASEIPEARDQEASLHAGDVLMVTRLDRLARATRDLLNVLAALAEKDAQFRSVRDTWADTTTSHGRLMLTVLGGLAEFERDLIRSRTSEGRARAKARGVKLGRRPKLSPAQQSFVAKERAQGESVRRLARVLGVSKATIGRIPAAES